MPSAHRPPIASAMLRRLLLAFAIALALGPVPGTMLRTPPRSQSQQIVATRLTLDPVLAADLGTVAVAEGWVIDSPNSDFGGYSALALSGDRQFILASDTGKIARLTLARDGAISRASIGALSVGPGIGKSKGARDLESLTSGGPDRTIWAGYEHSNQIWRFNRDLSRAQGHVAPRAMREWNANGGAESLARLADGRFLVLAETTGGPHGGTAGLLFAADPVANPRAVPISFSYDSQGKGRATDAVQLPGGLVLILHRRLTLFGIWTSTLAIADPALIRADRPWHSRTIATFKRPYLSENFEGLALDRGTTDAHGTRAGASVWMVSDDNIANWQRTLLLRLDLPDGLMQPRAIR